MKPKKRRAKLEERQKAFDAMSGTPLSEGRKSIQRKGAKPACYTRPGSQKR